MAVKEYWLVLARESNAAPENTMDDFEFVEQFTGKGSNRSARRLAHSIASDGSRAFVAKLTRVYRPSRPKIKTIKLAPMTKSESQCGAAIN